MKLIEKPEISIIAKTETVINLNGESLISFAAKQSTQSKSHQDITEKLLKSGHLSVFEHFNITVLISGITRGLANELTRHRHFSFTQRSTRYCIQDSYVIPVIYRPTPPQEWIDDITTIHQIYKKYSENIDKGDKQKLELAKQFVPACAEANIVVTGNLRTWIEFFPKRLSLEASLEFQVLTQMLKGVIDATPIK